MTRHPQPDSVSINALRTLALQYPETEEGIVVLLIAVRTKKLADLEPHIAHRAWSRGDV